MKTLLLSTMMIGLLLAECDYDCDCPDVNLLHIGNPTTLVYEKKTGCDQLFTCTSKNHLANLVNSFSNIPDIEEEFVAALFSEATPMGDRPVVTKDYFTEFGLVCQNSTWFATKFPKGFNYGSGPYDPEIVNGKGYRAAISSFTCT